jgi:hypothetical protein
MSALSSCWLVPTNADLLKIVLHEVQLTIDSTRQGAILIGLSMFLFNVDLSSTYYIVTVNVVRFHLSNHLIFLVSYVALRIRLRMNKVLHKNFAFVILLTHEWNYLATYWSTPSRSRMITKCASIARFDQHCLHMRNQLNFCSISNLI